jgi:16S rRNA (guanine527-N7)-methyltransferase
MPRPESSALTDVQIAAALLPFGIAASTEQVSQIREYISILLKWNKLLSLTTITDPIEIVSRHFGESVFLGKILALENASVVDVGTGAGFPGLALKIAWPSVGITLVESNKKKCAFLSEVARSLRLGGVEVLADRFDDLHPVAPKFDVITARALGGFPDLLRWAKPLLSARGHVALWAGGEDTTRISMIDGWIWNPAIRIPESQRRLILTGRVAL